MIVFVAQLQYEQDCQGKHDDSIKAVIHAGTQRSWHSGADLENSATSPGNTVTVKNVFQIFQNGLILVGLSF